MRKLISQIMKFGVVGVLAFIIDYGIFVLLANVFNIYYLIANFFGFTVSLIFNYLMSMKFVFERKEKINDYSVKDTFKIIGLTLFTILIAVLLAFIIYVLWTQVFDFIQSIAGEVVYRIGS